MFDFNQQPSPTLILDENLGTVPNHNGCCLRYNRRAEELLPPFTFVYQTLSRCAFLGPCFTIHIAGREHLKWQNIITPDVAEESALRLCHGIRLMIEGQFYN